MLPQEVHVCAILCFCVDNRQVETMQYTFHVVGNTYIHTNYS